MTHRSVRGVLAGRGFMLFPAAAFAVHELRYRLAYGSHAGQALAQQGHGYLDSLAPWVVLLAAVATGSFLARAARTVAGRDDRRPSRSLAALWLLTSASLIGIYVLQEWLESVFAAGHPGGVAGIFGHGGWWAGILSLAAGLIVACLLRLAAAVVEVISSRSVSRPLAFFLTPLRRPEAELLRLRTRLAGAVSGRGPPGRLEAVAV